MPRPPWVENPVIEWDDGNIEHLAYHSVTTAEIDGVFEQGEYTVSPHPKRRIKKYARRFLVRGHTTDIRRAADAC